MFTLVQLKKSFQSFLYLAFEKSSIVEIENPTTKSESLKEGEEKSDLQKELEKRLETIEVSLKFLSSYGKSLDRGLKRVKKTTEDNEDRQEIEALKQRLGRIREEYRQFLREGKQVKDKLQQLRGDIEDLQKSVDKIEFKKGIEIGENGKIEKNQLSPENLKTITNHEFLKLSPEQRLQYITKNHIDAKSVASGQVKSLEFTFTFDGKFNDELYLRTTAGQVLPPEVRAVESNGIIYTRNGLKGEFFAQGGRRFTIHEGTKIDNIKLASPEEMQKLSSEIQKNKRSFLEKNPQFEQFGDIVEEAYSRGIEPSFAIEAFGEQLSKHPLTSKERKALLEDMFTEYDRVKGNLPSDINNSEDGLKVLILRQFGGNNWMQKAEKLGISADTIKKFEKYNGLSNIDLNNLPNGVKGLLELIGHFESGGNYNAIYGNSKQNRIDFTNMTLKDVINFSREHGRKTGSSAIGKYQFLSGTLLGLVKENNIDLNEKFTPELQDKLAIKLLERRGLNQFLNGNLSKEKFIRNLSKEWASLPKDSSGFSFYHGDHIGNRAGKNSYAYLDKVLSRMA